MDGAEPGAKVRVIPNFVDTELINPAERENAYRRDHGLQGRTVVMYAGNVGFSQSLDLVVEAARALADERPDVLFVINGGGAARPALEASAAGLDNVRFVDMQPKARLPEVLAAMICTSCPPPGPDPLVGAFEAVLDPGGRPAGQRAVDEGHQWRAQLSRRVPGGPSPPMTPLPSWPPCELLARPAGWSHRASPDDASWRVGRRPPPSVGPTPTCSAS